mmetsp:Transcript_10661/g.16063  ORF Transcript_10661/g.16063 Transcript_10661/m.16063 type:complete len:222 (+) Transcript_10661:44-709(+)
MEIVSLVVATSSFTCVLSKCFYLAHWSTRRPTIMGRSTPSRASSSSSSAPIWSWTTPASESTASTFSKIPPIPSIIMSMTLLPTYWRSSTTTMRWKSVMKMRRIVVKVAISMTVWTIALVTSLMRIRMMLIIHSSLSIASPISVPISVPVSSPIPFSSTTSSPSIATTTSSTTIPPLATAATRWSFRFMQCFNFSRGRYDAPPLQRPFFLTTFEIFWKHRF